MLSPSPVLKPNANKVPGLAVMIRAWYLAASLSLFCVLGSSWEAVDEPPTQRPQLENSASAIRWSKTDASGHWSPITVPETKEMWIETGPEMLWKQQVEDHVWENTVKPVCLFQEEWSDLFGSTRDNIAAYVNFNQSKDTGLTATKMTRNDELPRHLILDSEWPRFLQATVAEWTAILDTPSNCALQTRIPWEAR